MPTNFRSALQTRFGSDLYVDSLIEADDAALALVRFDQGKRLIVAAPIDHAWLDRFGGETSAFDHDHVLKVCPLDTANARALRKSCRISILCRWGWTPRRAAAIDWA